MKSALLQIRTVCSSSNTNELESFHGPERWKRDVKTRAIQLRACAPAILCEEGNLLTTLADFISYLHSP